MKHLILYKTNEHNFTDAMFYEKYKASSKATAYFVTFLDIICRFCLLISIYYQLSHRHILAAPSSAWGSQSAASGSSLEALCRNIII